jgi:carboxymethylenebutenolidase
MADERMVTFTTPAGSAPGYLSRPRKGRPGVVVIQEWWGLVPHIKDVAGRLAGQGYLSLAPDLYDGKTTVEAEEARHLMEGLDWGRAAQQLAGAVAYLREVEGATKVGVVGFCMGGALTMIAACQPGVDAFAAFYGIPPKGAAPLEKITAPGLLIFGEHETHFSVPDARAFVEGQRQRGREAELVIYPGAGHGFFNDSRPEVFHKDAANDAWRRTLALFGEHLRG